jgi:polysaccharide export outer membrane protein
VLFRPAAWTLPLLLTACAGTPAVPMRPAAELTTAPAPADPPAAALPAPIPPEPPPPPPAAVSENRTFVTVNGVPLYRIGSGDVLDVIVLRGLTQDRQTVTVRSDGTVSVGLASAAVDGATVEQAADRLREGLALYFREPRVEVVVKEYNSRRVTVLGAVGGAGGRGGAGVYPLTGRNSLSEILARAGGAAPGADLQRVQLTRVDGSRYTVNLYRLISEGDLRQDVVLDTGDAVFIPAIAAGPTPALAAGSGAPVADQPRVFVFGEARTPGAYTYSAQMHISQLVAMAGGIWDTGLAESVRVIRGNLDRPEIIEVNFERLLAEGDRRQDVALQPNDIVVIPRSGMGNWNAFLAKIRPTLDFLILSATPVSQTQGIILQQRSIDRGPTFR